MSLLQKIGLGKQMEEIARSSFEEIVLSSINPRSIRASFLCLGEIDKARKLLKGINDQLGFDQKTGLVLDRGFNNGKWTPGSKNLASTALLSFAYSLADKKEKKEEQLPKGSHAAHPYRDLPQNV